MHLQNLIPMHFNWLRLLPILLVYFAQLLPSYAQLGQMTPFTWATGTYRLNQTILINQVTITGPTGFDAWYDITVVGLNWYDEPAGNAFNGAGQWGFVIASGFVPELPGPGPMGRPAGQATIGPIRWVIPNMGELHNLPPRPGYSAIINFYDAPPTDPTANLTGSASTRAAFVDVENNLMIDALDFSAGTYNAGDLLTATVTYRNGDPFFGFGEPGRMSRPVHPLELLNVDFRLTTDPNWDQYGSIFDDFELKRIAIYGDGLNGQSYRDSFMDPLETTTITTDMLVPLNYAGTYFLGVQIDSMDSPDIEDIVFTDNWYVNDTTAHIRIIDNNSPTLHPVSEVSDDNGNQLTSGDDHSESPSVSGNGARIAFRSIASNLVANDTNGLYDIFVRQRDTGDLQLVSVNSNGEQANRNSQDPFISANGRYVAFSSQATNLVDGDVGGYADIFVHDVETGETVRVSRRIFRLGDIDYVLEADGSSFYPTLSEDGRFVLFTSYARNLDPRFIGLFPPGTSRIQHIYLHDRCFDNDFNNIDEPSNTRTYLISTASDGQTIALENSNTPRISLDGQWVVYSSFSQNLNPGITLAGQFISNPSISPNNFQQVYRRQLFDGFYDDGTYDDWSPQDLNGNNPHNLAHTLELMSVSTNGELGNSDSYQPAVNENGSEIAFASEATNFDLRMADENEVPDIFVRSYQDQIGKTFRVSISSGGNEAVDIEEGVSSAAGSIEPAMDRTGRFVTFRSNADSITQLAPLLNGSSDIFLHDRDADGNGRFDEVENSGTTTQVVSVNRFGYAARGLVGAVDNFGTSFITASYFGVPTSWTSLFSSSSSRNPSMSADGRFIAFESDADDIGGLRFGRTNLFPLDLNNVRDVYMYDRNVVPRSTTPGGGNGSGDNPDLPDLFPPHVQVLTPGTGSQFTIGSKLFITAFATDTRATTADEPGVVKVDFIINGDVIAVDESFPYSTTYSPVDADIYSIRARATDTDGFVTFSDPVQIEAVVSSARLPEIELIYPRDGQQFLTAQDVPFIAEIPGSPNIPGATFLFLAFYVDGEEVFNTTTQSNTFQHLHQFVDVGEQKINAVIAYSVPGPNGTIVNAQAISNTVTVEVLPATGSQLPIIDILYPPPTPAGQPPIAITSASTVRLLANARDPDGDLECVQFFVNGIPVGNKVFRTTSQAPEDFPFSVEWKPDSPGKYVVTAVAQDSGGNKTTSFPVTITSTSGVNPPQTFLTDPFTPPQASLTVGPQGEIQEINLLPLEKGGNFDTVPLVQISGQKDIARAEAVINDSGGISQINILHSGSGYTRTPFVTIAGDGFGASARAIRGDLDGDGFRDELQSIIITKPGTGYTVAHVVVSGGHQEATAVVALDTDGSLVESSLQAIEEGSGYLNGSITAISVLNQGTEYDMNNPPFVFIDEPLSTSSDARQAVASAELTFDGRIKRINILDGGNGYNIPLRLDNTQCTMDTNGSVLSSSDPAFLADFVDEFFVNYGPAVNTIQGAEIGYPTLRLEGSTSNDGVYSVLSVSRTGGIAEIILFPDLNDEIAILELWAEPAPPQVLITPPSSSTGVQATAVASVTSPTVKFSQVLNIIPNLPSVPIVDAQGNVIGSQLPSPLVGVPLSATAYDPGPDGISGNADDGIITNIDFYINGTALPDDVLQSTSDGGMNVFAIWKPDALGVHEIMAISVDDDGNTTSSRAVEVYVDYVEQVAQTFAPKVWITTPADEEVFNLKVNLTPPTPGTTPGAVDVPIETLTIEVRAEPGDINAKATITQVQLFANNAPLGVDADFPYQFQFTPTSLGKIEFVAEATDIFGNVSYSNVHTVSVTDGEAWVDGSTFIGEGPIVRITEPGDGSEYIVKGSQGTDPINIFVDASPNPNHLTHLIAQVEFYVNGNFIFADTQYPYVTQFIPPGKGQYEIRAVARDTRMVRSDSDEGTNTTKSQVTITVIEDPVLTPNDGLDPGDSSDPGTGTRDYTEDEDEAFVIIIHRDLYLRNPTTSELANNVNALQTKSKTRAELIYDMLQFQENTRNMETSMVQYLITGSWPTRQEVIYNAFLFGQGAIDPITGDTMPLTTASGNPVERINFNAVPNPETNQRNNNNQGGGGRNNQGGFGGNFGQQQQFQISDYQYTSPNIQFPNVREASIGGIDRGDEDTSFILATANPTPTNPPITGTITVGPWTGMTAVGMYHYYKNHTFSRHAFDIDENDLVGAELYKRKYGLTLSSNSVQYTQLMLFMDYEFETSYQGYFEIPDGVDSTTFKAIDYNNEAVIDVVRTNFIIDFARDNEIESSGGSTNTKLLELLNPPNNLLEDNAYAHTLWVSLARQTPNELEFAEVRDQGSLMNQIEFILNSDEYASRFSSSTSTATRSVQATNWAFGADTFAPDWFELDNFGVFTTQQITKGWVMHYGKNLATPGLGWIYTPFSQRPNSVWFYHEDLGWCWTSLADDGALYPYIYCNEGSCWLYFNDSQPGDPWLYNYKTENWTQLK